MAFRGPATLLTQTDLSRLKPEDRETATKIAAKLKHLRGAAGIESALNQRNIAMRGQRVDKAQVNPDLTVVENGWITLVAYQSKGYAYIVLHLMGPDKGPPSPPGKPGAPRRAVALLRFRSASPATTRRVTSVLRTVGGPGKIHYNTPAKARLRRGAVRVG